MNTSAIPNRALPPKLTRARPAPSVWLGGALLGLLVLGGMLLVFFFDPAVTPFYPQCAFHRLTGLNCPGCGATRGLFALLHGHWRQAWQDNALFLLTLAALTAWAGWLGWQWTRRRPVPSLLPTWSLIPWLVLALVFGVIRNLPLGAFLSP
jgi:hypothetical protein